MSDPRWQRIEEICHAALERAPDERALFVREACAGDDALRGEVQSLLANQSRADALGSGLGIRDSGVGMSTDELIGTQIGVYRIVSLLGAGGMGEVYRARDTRLHRDVALKILPAAFAIDPDRVRRFQREATTLASLNHPNIAHIHGLEESNGVRALVMELVEGEDLSRRIARGPISIDEALPIAKQIAEALEAAHEQGIIHRDLKPANVKVRDDGTVKVLDFGLAKALEPISVRMDATAAPTITSPAMVTGVGVLLGTPAYMSPEQSRGKPVDKRADLWAFGCVIYEMLTGTRPFAGDDLSEVMASVLAREPDWTRLPSTLSPALGTYIRRCLYKDPKQRIGDAQDVRLALEGAFEAAVAPPVAPVGLTRPAGWRVATLAASIAITAAVVAGVVWFVTRPPVTLPPRVSRLLVTTSGAAALTISGQRGLDSTDVAITPDGSRLIYVGNRGTQLFVRALADLEPVPVFTGTPRQPFVSPNGQWIGFIDGNRTLKKVAVTGGTAVTVTTIDGPTPRGATWLPDDTIIFATADPATGLQQVPASPGGTPTVLTRPDRAQGEADHQWPEAMPDGRAVLFTVLATTSGLEAAQVVVLDLETRTRTVLIRGGSHGHYVPSGHLLYATPGTLRAIRFDPTRLESIIGTSVAVVRDVVTTAYGAVNAVVAGDGTLAYVPGGAMAQAMRTLVWVDRQGRETPIQATPRAYLHPRLSPDGARVVVFTADQELDLWSLNLARPTLTPVTSSPGSDSNPLWTPNGDKLIFSSQRAGVLNLFSQAADGTGEAEPLAKSPNIQLASAISPDGDALIFTETFPTTAEDVMQLTLDESHTVTPLVKTAFSERNGIVSPNGQWLAYEANDSGRFEIFVVPFPGVSGHREPVTTAGGTRALWGRNGRELFYVSPTGAVMRVGVEPGPSWAATPPTVLVKEGYFAPTGNSGRSYDYDPRQQQFLMIKESGGDRTAAPASIVVVQHWVEELKRLVPTK